MDQDACYQKLVSLLHPGGMSCPVRQASERLRVHRRHRVPVLDYRGTACGRGFNAFAPTESDGTHRRPAGVMPILRGYARGVPTAKLARELGRDRSHPPELRRRMRDEATRWLDRNPLRDAVVEADEMDQDAGEEGREHGDPDGPRRRRARPWRGHGTIANDRPPVAAVDADGDGVREVHRDTMEGIWTGLRNNPRDAPGRGQAMRVAVCGDVPVG